MPIPGLRRRKNYEPTPGSNNRTLARSESVNPVSFPSAGGLEVSLRTLSVTYHRLAPLGHGTRRPTYSVSTTDNHITPSRIEPLPTLSQTVGHDHHLGAVPTRQPASRETRGGEVSVVTGTGSSPLYPGECHGLRRTMGWPASAPDRRRAQFRPRRQYRHGVGTDH